jgi:hypothetical protein
MPTVTIREATVQTVQIEIKALKVGKKQVTMGLFRQLPLASLIDPDSVQLQGIPWGHVIYWWDGDGRPSSTSTRTLLHIVWQDGDTLRRAIVSAEPYKPRMSMFEDQLTVLSKYFYCVALRDDPTMRVDIPHYSYGDPYAHVLYQNERHRVVFYDEDERRIIGQFAAHRTDKSAQEAYAAWLKDMALTDTTAAECGERFRKVVFARNQYTARWKKQVDALRELPQLFIAV